MGKIPEQLRQVIARNIRACRMERFPGRGGGKKCAEAFGVSPQQWSPWERGMRTPDELRLAHLADFFGVTVEYLRRDNSAHGASSKNNPLNAEPGASSNGETPRDRANHPYPPMPEYSCCPFYRPPMPGQPLSSSIHSLCWLAERFFGDMREFGITIRLHPDDIDRIVGRVLAEKPLPL